MDDSSPTRGPGGVISPNDPNWAPDPTGQRLAAIRASRRGGLLAGAYFGVVVAIAIFMTPPEGFGAPNGAGVWALVMALPGLALLGAGLTPAALGSRFSAASAGLAIGVGAPVAAVASAMLGTFVLTVLVLAMYPSPTRDAMATAADMAGVVLRDGVIAAARVAPLIVVASVSWVVVVRRWIDPAAELARNRRNQAG
jgi:hypothetical protein